MYSSSRKKKNTNFYQRCWKISEHDVMKPTFGQLSKGRTKTHTVKWASKMWNTNCCWCCCSFSFMFLSTNKLSVKRTDRSRFNTKVSLQNKWMAMCQICRFIRCDEATSEISLGKKERTEWVTSRRCRPLHYFISTWSEWDKHDSRTALRWLIPPDTPTAALLLLCHSRADSGSPKYQTDAGEKQTWSII